MSTPLLHTPILHTMNLSRDFGGVHAVQDVSIGFSAGQIHAVIGPNGAGKTTLINLLSGDIHPSQGSIYLNDSDITGASPQQIARLGMARSYQQTQIIGDMTCRENCCLGAQVRQLNTMHFFRPASGYEDINALADQALIQVGLENRRNVPAANLSHGEQRQLEIGMVLASDPSLILLDEPLAGMGVGDSRRMIDLLKQISGSRTIVLIEHDMDAVFELADILTVMVDGRVLKTGSPDEVRADAMVQRAYLGGAE